MMWLKYAYSYTSTFIRLYNSPYKKNFQNVFFLRNFGDTFHIILADSSNVIK